MSLQELSLKAMSDLRDKTNKLFRKNGIVFVHNRFPEEQIESLDEKVHPIYQLHIEKSDIPALYEQITNTTKFQQVVKQVVTIDIMNLLKQIQTLSKKQQEEMPNDVIQNIEIIKKYVIQFQKRLNMTLRTSFDDCNEVAEVQEKAREVLSKAFREGLIVLVMPALLTGIKSNPNYYNYLVDYFSDFLERCGIYTHVYQVNQPIDYEYLVPEGVVRTEDESLHGKINDLLQLPYFFNDHRYEGQALLSEGQCIAWRFEKGNGNE
jgi:hypothetical protein